MYLTISQEKTKCLASFLYLSNLISAPPDDEPGGQELEEHGEGRGGGGHRDGQALFEVDRGQQRPELTRFCTIFTLVALPEGG